MISVAIDGPAGAGKSTVAKAAAEKLGFIYVDTGALYRAIGLKFSNCGYDRDSDMPIDGILSNTKIDIAFENGEQHVYLDGKDVSSLIRTPEASMMASAVSSKPEVRAFLLEVQRELARKNNVIMDGRDIGTVVLPNAQVKIFLTASVRERALRRYRELTEKGMKVELFEIEEDIKTRDYNDSHREIAPLKPAEDSILADTTGNNLEESTQMVVKIIKDKLGAEL
mgnify:FL=1